jgi:hypothetical protein
MANNPDYYQLELLRLVLGYRASAPRTFSAVEGCEL